MIGAGPSGLATAVLLGRRGYKVLVVEQHDRAGGGLHTFEEHFFQTFEQRLKKLFQTFGPPLMKQIEMLDGKRRATGRRVGVGGEVAA